MKGLFTLNNGDAQLLKESLLAFVKRVAFDGAEFDDEADAFILVVNLLLGIPAAWDLNLSCASEQEAEEENSKTRHARECQHMVECIRECCSFQICNDE